MFAHSHLRRLYVLRICRLFLAQFPATDLLAVCQKLYRNNHFSFCRFSILSFVGCSVRPRLRPHLLLPLFKRILCELVGLPLYFLMTTACIAHIYIYLWSKRLVIVLEFGSCSCSGMGMNVRVYGFSRISDIAWNMIFIWINITLVRMFCSLKMTLVDMDEFRRRFNELHCRSVSLL